MTHADIADARIKAAVRLVAQHYPTFGETAHDLSDGSWEEWIRNQVEAHIYLAGGTTLSGVKK